MRAQATIPLLYKRHVWSGWSICNIFTRFSRSAEECEVRSRKQSDIFKRWKKSICKITMKVKDTSVYELVLRVDQKVDNTMQPQYILLRLWEYSFQVFSLEPSSESREGIQNDRTYRLESTSASALVLMQVVSLDCEQKRMSTHTEYLSLSRRTMKPQSCELLCQTQCSSWNLPVLAQVYLSFLCHSHQAFVLKRRQSVNEDGRADRLTAKPIFHVLLIESTAFDSLL